jgi:acyl transferase domain-containing protein
VVSGANDDVQRVSDTLATAGHRTRQLRVSHAFHSPLMEPMLEEFRAVAERTPFHPPVLPLVSTVTGRIATEDELRDPGYWVRQVRAEVRFHDGVNALRTAGADAFLEIGPDAVLTALVRETLADEVLAVPFQQRDKDEIRTGLTALGTLWTAGAPVAWDAVFDGTGARRTDLPGYPFEHHRYWLDAVMPESVGPTSEHQTEAWADRLAGLGDADRARLLLDLVRGEVALVLGHSVPDAVAPDATLRDLGLDSLAAVTLRNSLASTLDLPVPATLAFEHPNPLSIAEFLAEQLTSPSAPPVDIDVDLDRIRAAALTVDEDERARIAGLLRQLTAELSGRSSVAAELADADDEDVFAFIDNELGIGSEDHYV